MSYGSRQTNRQKRANAKKKRGPISGNKADSRELYYAQKQRRGRRIIGPCS